LCEELLKYHNDNWMILGLYRKGAFEVKTDTRQVCMPFLFLLVINWVTRQSMDGQRTGIQWISGKILEDLEYTDIHSFINTHKAAEKIQ